MGNGAVFLPKDGLFAPGPTAGDAAACPSSKSYKEAAWAKMKRSKVHPMYLNDDHWELLWGKHFDRPRHGEAQAYDDPIAHKFEGRTLRVLQWNLLAEGLAPE